MKRALGLEFSYQSPCVVSWKLSDFEKITSPLLSFICEVEIRLVCIFDIVVKSIPKIYVKLFARLFDGFQVFVE